LHWFSPFPNLRFLSFIFKFSNAKSLVAVHLPLLFVCRKDDPRHWSSNDANDGDSDRTNQKRFNHCCTSQLLGGGFKMTTALLTKKVAYWLGDNVQTVLEYYCHPDVTKAECPDF
jgi:hypothetical protein